jgi:hypothetical protein
VTGRTVHVVQADGPRVTDGQSEKESRPSSSAPQITNSLCPVLGRSTSNRYRADGLRRPGGRSVKLLPPETAGQMDRNEDAQEHATNTKNPKPISSTRTVCANEADCPPGANSHGKNRPRARTWAPYLLSFHGSPKRLKVLRKDLGTM